MLRLPGNTPFRGPQQVQQSFITNDEVRPDLTLFDSAELQRGVRQPADAADRRRPALRRAAVRRGPGRELLPAAAEGAGQLRRPGRLRRHPRRGAGPGVRRRRRRGGRRTATRIPTPPRTPATPTPTADADDAAPTAAAGRRGRRRRARTWTQAVADIDAALDALADRPAQRRLRRARARRWRTCRPRSRPTRRRRRPRRGDTRRLSGGGGCGAPAPSPPPPAGTVVATDAGWSSSVARWAHNPEVAGSNPAPATTEKPSQSL